MKPEIESPQGKYVDPAVHRKSKNIQNEKKIRYIEGFPIFTLIEFNIYGACNRDCSFCPVSNLDVYTNKYEGFSISLFTKIIRDLYDLSYDGKLLFSAFSEPFLNKDLPSLVAIVKGMLPNASLEIVSNGDVFKKRTKKLLDVIAAGVDTVSVSIYDGPEETAEFKKIIEDLGLSSDQIILRRRYYTKEKKNHGMIISNRSGTVESNLYRDETEKPIYELPLARNCFYPFYQTLIDYNGDMILCPHDWEKKYIVGNLSDSHIWDLWKSKKYEGARKMLSNKNRNFSPCVNCDVKGDVMGDINYEYWRNRQR